MTPEELWARLKPSKDEIERLLESREAYRSLFGLSEEEAREFNEAFEESCRQLREQNSHLEVVMMEVPLGDGRIRRLPVVRPRVELEEKDVSTLPADLADQTWPIDYPNLLHPCGNQLDTRAVYHRMRAMGKSVDQTKRLADYLEECRVVDEAHHFEGGQSSGKSFRSDVHLYMEPPPAEAEQVSSGKPKPKLTNRYGSPFDFKPRKGRRFK